REPDGHRAARAGARLHRAARPRKVQRLTPRSLEPEAPGAHERAEIGTQRLGVLPRLVLGPAVEFRLAPTVGIALAGGGPPRRPAPVISVDLLREIARCVAVLVQPGRQGEPPPDL